MKKENVYFICTTCGIQYESSGTAPEFCPVCEDERQYVNPEGQSWTTLDKISQNYHNKMEQVAPDLYAIYTSPPFAIGQRAHLLITPNGNLLWDCITNLDSPTIDKIRQLGGIKAIAISHPHYYATMMEWSHTFGGIPVYINKLDAKWLGRQDPVIELWEGSEFKLWDNIKLVHCGGHFPGANILYVPFGHGSILAGDVIQVCPDRKSVSFMYSYPNYIPLSAEEVNKIYAVVKYLDFDAIYGAFGNNILHDGKEALDFSVKRYLNRIRS